MKASDNLSVIICVRVWLKGLLSSLTANTMFYKASTVKVEDGPT